MISTLINRAVYPNYKRVLLSMNVGSIIVAGRVYTMLCGGLSQINQVLNWFHKLLDLVFITDLF